MKNFKPFLSKIFTLFIVILLIISCSSCEKQQDDSNLVTQEDIEAMKAEHLISLNNAVKSYKKYDKDRVKILKDTLEKKYKDPKFKDTRMVWFDIKDVRAYLKYLEQETADAEGLAFYFSVNSDKASGKKKNHQTFFIAPTISNVVDGDTIQSGYTIDKGQRIFLYTKYKNKRAEATDENLQKASFFSLVQNDEGYLFNEGKDSPPGGNN